MNGFGMGGMWLWWLLPIFIVIVLYLIAKKEEPRSESAKEILDKRLAKGEINEETYNKLRQKLES